MNVKPKRVLFETYGAANFEMSNLEYTDGILGVFASEQSFNDRSLKDDPTLRFLGGLIAKDIRKRPAYFQAMMNDVPDDCVLAYVGPGSADNKTAMSIPNGVNIDSCPGVWCIQIAAPTPEKYLTTFRVFIEHAI